MKDYCSDLQSHRTAFEIRETPTQIFALLKQALTNKGIEFTVSLKAWKIKYRKKRELLNESKSGQKDQISIVEEALIAIELKRVTDEKICVEFRRKAGSSLIFYDQFHMIRNDLEML